MSAEATGYPATISIEEKIKQLIESDLDSNHFMYLGKPTQRDELFLFGLALGWRHRLSTELSKPCSGGFVRTSSFSTKLVAAIDLLRFASSDYVDANVLRDHKESYKIAERYANAGLHMIEDEIKNGEDSETYANHLIAEMNDMYDEWSCKYHYAAVKI